MELLCALLGKAPRFGLMTDEGRMAKWLVEVKTTKEPDWGVVGTAIGRKCVEDVPYITGLEKYFKGGKVKLRLALAKGKQRHDKRETIRRRDQKRELERERKNNR